MHSSTSTLWDPTTTQANLLTPVHLRKAIRLTTKAVSLNSQEDAKCAGKIGTVLKQRSDKLVSRLCHSRKSGMST